MHPVLFRLGPLSVYSWGTMVALAFLAGLFTAVRYAKKEGIKEDHILELFIYVVVSSIAGARLFYVMGFFGQFRNDPVSILCVNEGGLVFIGGLFASFLTVLIYVKLKGLNLWKLLDALSPASALGYGIGRIGCFLNGCCYGVTLFGIEQPTQIYSSIAGFVIFAVLIKLYDSKKYDGQIFIYALIMYCVYRFLVEFLRYSPVHVYIFTLNQLLIAPVLIFSLYLLWKKNTT